MPSRRMVADCKGYETLTRNHLTYRLSFSTSFHVCSRRLHLHLSCPPPSSPSFRALSMALRFGCASGACCAWAPSRAEHRQRRQTTILPLPMSLPSSYDVSLDGNDNIEGVFDEMVVSLGLGLRRKEDASFVCCYLGIT